MASISDKVAQIRQAVYGKDVRESIASGIEAINSEVETTTAKQAQLETTFEQLIINAGNSNAEIVDARGGFDTLRKKLDSYAINVKDFGAKGDGVTDDTAAIIAAFNALTKNKTLVFPSGTYVFKNESPITLQSDNVKIIMSPDTTIKLTQTNYFITASGKRNIEFEGGKIVGAQAVGLSTFFFSECEFISMRNMEITDSSGTGIKLENCSNCRFTNVYSHHNYYYGAEDVGGQNNIWENCVFNYNGRNSDGTLKSDGGRGIVLWRCKHCVVKHCTCIGNSEYGIRLYAVSYEDEPNVGNIIDGNYCKDNGDASTGSIDIYIFSSNFENKIINNTIERSVAYGTCISVEGKNNIVSNNVLVNLNNNQLLNAIVLYGADNCVFDHNIIRGFNSAFIFSSSSLPIECVVSNNIAEDVSYFIYALYGSGHKIQNNKAVFGGSNTNSIGINTGSAGTGCICTGNILIGFNRGFQIGDNEIFISQNTTINSTNVGLYKYGNVLSGVNIFDNNFDKTYPGILQGLISHPLNAKHRIGFYPQPPTSLTWDVGDIIFNSAPTDGGFIGWVCVQAGTPGVWKGFGTIAS